MSSSNTERRSAADRSADSDGGATADLGSTARRVTIIDDSPEFVAMISEVLGDAYAVTGIQPQSLDEIARTRPDLLMVDLNPRHEERLTGWHAIEQVRNDGELREVPIILCTGHVGSDGKLQVAVDDYRLELLVKPFTLDQLDAVMARALRSGGSGEAGGGERGDGAA